jgi:NitT/TauT family transport system substrate-binding protein
MLKATDLCANEPARVARLMVDQGFTDNYGYALQTLQELPYRAWRDFDPEDSVRYFALRLNEAGFIKSTPDRIIAEHTNWRFFNEVKRELESADFSVIFWQPVPSAHSRGSTARIAGRVR